MQNKQEVIRRKKAIKRLTLLYYYLRSIDRTESKPLNSEIYKYIDACIEPVLRGRPFFVTAWDIIELSNLKDYRKWCSDNNVLVNVTLHALLGISKNDLFYIRSNRSRLRKQREHYMKYLQISDITKPGFDQPLWAINNTSGDNRGPCMFVVERPNSPDRDNVVIPDTWLPIDLENFAPRNNFMQSTNFRQALRSGAIRLVTEDYALELRSQPGAQEEQNRLDKIKTDFTPVRAEEEENTIRVQHIINGMDGKKEVEVLNQIRNIPDLQVDELRAIRKAARSHDWKKVGKACKLRIEELDD